MQSPPHDTASALALRSQYRQSQSRAARLRLLVDTGQELSGLTPADMGLRTLQRACAFLAMDHGVLLEWSSNGQALLRACHAAGKQLADLQRLADASAAEAQWLAVTDASLPCALQIPLRAADGRVFGALLLANSVPLNMPDREDIESLQLLATLLAAHLENSRLLEALQTRERSMSELVHRLFSAQEDERKRVAYDLHDGLAQTLAGLHQRLQGFAGRCPSLPAPLDAELQTILTLAKGCVGEGRQLISGLRPNVLDDFGLLQAVDKEADRLRDAGLDVSWGERSGVRLPGVVEIALFRIAQEGINNILKHACASHVHLSLACSAGFAQLQVQDNGCGFVLQPRQQAPAPHSLGLVAMAERASLQGGDLQLSSRPGEGTCVQACVPFNPLWEAR